MTALDGFVVNYMELRYLQQAFGRGLFFGQFSELWLRRSYATESKFRSLRSIYRYKATATAQIPWNLESENSKKSFLWLVGFVFCIVNIYNWKPPPLWGVN